ncbi:class I SAM-dependent methyltransferase [Spirillospora sp. NPDC050679]
MSGFAAVESQWRERLRRLPNATRQELTARQLDEHLPPVPARVLDVGCGQGTQALRLAAAGHQVTGLDHSATMLSDFERALADHPPHVRDRVRLVQGEGDRLVDHFADSSFDVVLCHGVLMYLDDPVPLLAAMAQVTAPGGIVSLLVRNGDALALQPGLRGDWAAATAAFGTTRYRNRIGVHARADRRADLLRQLADVGLALRQWYGVLNFVETAAMEEPVPPPEQFEEILACEDRAGRTDPYRQIAAMLHFVASRPPD